MISDYKITGKTVPGAIYLRYEKKMLAAIVLELTQRLNLQVWSYFKSILPDSDDSMKVLSETFEVKKLDSGRSVQDKIIMFNGSYKFYRGVPYQPKEVEKANLKNVPVTRELLDTFFKSPLANYTLDNYIKRINITRDWARNGQSNHLMKQMPEDYDPTFAATLSSEDLVKYQAKLRENGYVYTQERGWIKNEI